MVTRSAVFEAIAKVCKGFDYEIIKSKSTDSIYLKIKYGFCQVCLRFSDHKGENNLKWFDYSASEANYAGMVRYIQNKIKVARYHNMKKCWAKIAQNR